MFDLEVLLLLVVALFFSLVYEVKRELTWSGIIGSMTWIIMSLVYFVGAASADPQKPYVLALFFSGIGIIYIIRWMIDLVDVRKLSREIE